MKLAYFWLVLLLYTGVVATATLTFMGGSWLWPVAFFIGLIVAMIAMGDHASKATK